MEFDLDRPLRVKHKLSETLQQQILKASSFQTKVSLGTTRRGLLWRVPSTLSVRPKARRRGKKGSLRMFTVLDSSPCHPRPLRKFTLRSLDRKAGDTSTPEFQVTEASGSGSLQQEPKYLAVSYCWPRGSEKQRLLDSGEFYLVRDGRCPEKVRKTRAPKSIIDRAIAFAKDREFRMIWIDQECINQSDRQDKECGIRSMANVFHDAKKVVAFLQTAAINREIEIKALRRLSSHEYLEPDLYKAAVDTVERISEDPWFTRAWTLQEATSGGNTLELSIKCYPALEQSDTEEWGNVNGEIQFDWAHITKWIAGLYVQAVIYDLEPLPDLGFQELNDLVARIDAIRNSLMNHFPLVHEPTKMSRPRLCCNASAALAFLKERKNSRATDRISILANLGDYSIKLNTTKIGSLDMSACILAQALLNGDISLLSGIEENAWAKKQEDKGFSWLPPLDTTLQDVVLQHEGYPTLRLSEPSLTKQGLSIQGYYWEINEVIDVRSIKRDFLPQWTNSDSPQDPYSVISLLKRTQKDPNETLDDYRERLLDRAENYGSRILQPTEDDYGASPRHLVGSKILWELLSHLVRLDKLDLANSIWHSVRLKFPRRTLEEMQQAMQREKQIRMPGELPAILDECIARENNQLNLRVPFLNDESQVSRLFVPMEHNWEWLIERIMEKGSIWSGVSATNQDIESAACVFNVDSHCFILTPHCRGMEDMEDYGRLRSLSLPQMRSKRISWVIADSTKSNDQPFPKRKKPGIRRQLTKRMSWMSKTNIESNAPPQVATKGMVAGMWMLGNLKPTKTTLI
ncbi:MAG: hypothetical protein Q9160_006357 [Pyrenula sp. 1 TL-2023]